MKGTPISPAPTMPPQESNTVSIVIFEVYFYPMIAVSGVVYQPGQSQNQRGPKPTYNEKSYCVSGDYS
jgi:hypothetical protein